MLREQPHETQLYGLIAEFATPDAVILAARKAHEAGYRRMDAYSPLPVHGLAEAMGVRRTRVPFVVLVGALCGAVFGYGLQYYMTALAYVHNIGGRPIHSWPSYIPVTFETTVLFASLSAVVGMLVMNGLPQPYHPVFNHPRFAAEASTDRFFLCIEAHDLNFSLDETAQFLRTLDPVDVAEVYD